MTKVSGAPDWRPARDAVRLDLPMTGGDVGPPARGRGAVEQAEVPVVVYDPRIGARRVMSQLVARRSRGDGLRALDAQGQAVAMRYAGYVELAASVGGPGDGSRGAGLSDGGAVSRCRVAGVVRACRAAIGDGAWQPERRGHADRGHGSAVRLVDLVDLVCVGGLSLGGVLRRHGWPDVRGSRDHLARELRQAVDRMADVVGMA